MSEVRIGINGFGRIGSQVARVIATRRRNMDGIKPRIVAINDPFLDVDYMVYLVQHDTVFHSYDGKVSTKDGKLIIDDMVIDIHSVRDPKQIPWKESNVDVVVESTGVFVTSEACQAHLDAGAKKVIISAPAKDKETPMFVMGVNHKTMTKDMKIISNASCTTNCLAPLAKVINDNFKIIEGLMTTIHSVTNSQKICDSCNTKDYRQGRSGMQNIIPTTTGAARAVGVVIPELNGKLTGMAFRVPTLDGSVVDLTCRLEKATTMDEINQKMKEAAEGELKGILKWTDDKLVSADIMGEMHTSVFDSTACIALNEHFFKLVSWYDNEYGYSNKLVDLLLYMFSLDL
ncbi:glyceraldehyde-3-phosphate dehydrogenase-related [Anaeramoeba ignava]|uniref:Glyceraldehyde-3-phosphate dehydrogenase n=1 Tax=Anaeramoeba ignava TaxID=1746090 RepID=A0A9Q0LH21_ANAIG|nr:glyceraldehyde-3-phosphate dehydrogenase-related [Anaeramoeba ignava]|eukprot:Anaeramoba_ignava/a607400_2669.p1 GENE.a607400_2669~~a607400_2669.p1  ORF type:complete len:345 (-),score=97.51 a607400_2669:49-1083(-)